MRSDAGAREGERGFDQATRRAARTHRLLTDWPAADAGAAEALPPPLVEPMEAVSALVLIPGSPGEQPSRKTVLESCSGSFKERAERGRMQNQKTGFQNVSGDLVLQGIPRRAVDHSHRTDLHAHFL